MIEPTPKLTPKQQRFVQAFAANGGNASKAAEAAGYRLPRSQGSRLLTNVDIINAIDGLRQASDEATIATREERWRLWTQAMRGEIEGYEPRARLRASELLGKAQGDFVVRVEEAGVIVIERSYGQREGITAPKPGP